MFKLWINHGERPQKASYDYTVLPATTAEKIEEYLKNPSIETLANSGKMQAVANHEQGIYYIVFYEAAELTLSKDLTITSHAPSMVMLRLEGDNEIELTCSDPTREMEQIELEVNDQTIKLALPQGVYAGSSVKKIIIND